MADTPVAIAAVSDSVRPVPAASAAATRTVTYAGYQITVPADWPVYRLDTDPVQCIRYDIDAVCTWERREPASSARPASSAGPRP